MELGREGLGGVRATDSVSSDGRWGRQSRGRGVGQRRQRNVPNRFAASRTVLPVEFGRETIKRAWPHVLRCRRRVWRAGRG